MVEKQNSDQTKKEKNKRIFRIYVLYFRNVIEHIHFEQRTGSYYNKKRMALKIYK